MRITKALLFIGTLLFWGCITSQPIYQNKIIQQSEIVVSEQTMYDSAVYYFRQKQYDQSERMFSTIVNNYPKSDYAQRSAYMNGYLFTIGENPKKNYRLAKEKFEYFIKTYPKSRYRSDSQSWIGVISELEQTKINKELPDCDSLTVKNKLQQEEIKRLNFIIEQLQAAQKK